MILSANEGVERSNRYIESWFSINLQISKEVTRLYKLNEPFPDIS